MRISLLAPRNHVAQRLSGLLMGVFLVGLGIFAVHQILAAAGIALEAENAALSGAATIVARSDTSGRGMVVFGGGPAPAPSATPAPGPTTAPTGFAHPGILVSRTQLDFVKNQIANGAQPWTAALTRTKASRFASLNYTSHPAASMSRAAGSAQNFTDDSIAAYTDALIYAYTGNVQYADKGIAILNGWAGSLTGVASDAQLDAAWGAEVMPRAAEILRYTYAPVAGHAALNVAGLSRVMKNVLLPQLSASSPGAIYSNGNWELSMADGTMNIGVFTDDRAVFNTGVAMWRARLPAYIYESTDGPTPVPAPGSNYTAAQTMCIWATQTTSSTCTKPVGFALHDGMNQETCRDISHVTLGLEAAVHGAETARLQGVDLFGAERKRLVDGYEFAAKYDLQVLDHLAGNGLTGSVGDSICGGTLTVGGSAYTLGWELAYTEYAGRLKMNMPYTAQMIQRLRPTLAALHMDWETLVSAGTP